MLGVVRFDIVLRSSLECFCGNTLAAGSAAATDGRCSMVCAGDATEYCGGPNGLSLYKYVAPVLFSNTTVDNSTSTSMNNSFSTTSASSNFSTTAVLSTVSVTSSTTSPTPTGPSVLKTVGNYTHVDCYNEPSGGRALTGKLVASNDMTPQYCAGNCTSLGYKYMGLEYGQECFCGNSLASTSTVNTAGSCNMVCKGNRLYYCGGSGVLNLYTVSSNVTASNSTTTSSSSSTSSALSSSASSTMTSSAASSNATSLSTITSSASTTVSASANSTSTSSTAAATSSTAWTYYGCANETTGRALSAGGTASSDMTIEKCQAYCLSKSQPVAGLEYSTECYCGLGLSPGSTVNQTGCSMPCGGNSSQVCGGSNRLSVYQYSGYVAPSHPEKIGTYKFQGCYSEPSSGGRALPSYSFTNATHMSAELCVSGCSAKGYGYAGAEYGRECWCANAMSNSSMLLDTKSCNMLCPGNKAEYCGAGSRLSVWLNGTST